MYKAKPFLSATWERLLTLLMLSLLSGAVLAGEILKCKDENGKTVYTDSPAKCEGQVQIFQLHNLATSGGANFSSPRRSYQTIPGDWKIFVEQDMATADPKLTAAASSKLQQSLTEILGKLPGASHQHVKALNFYLMWGEKSPKGGEKSGMRAVKKVDPVKLPLYDPAWKEAVIIYSATNLMALDALWTKKALTHEIGHTWHLRDWPAKHPEIIATWELAKGAGLYRNVATYKGKTLASAYALTNEREYFAELTAMYFVGGDYHPYDRAGLMKYDAQGYKLVEQYWGLR